MLARDAVEDLVDDIPRFLVLVLELLYADLVADRAVAPEVLPSSSDVVLYHRVRGVKYILCRPVILLQLHDLRVREILVEIEYVRDSRAAELIYRLVVVADRHDVPVPAGEQLRQLELRLVRVLILVDRDVPEALLAVASRLLVLAEELHGLHYYVVEIERARRLETRLIHRVNPGELREPEIAPRLLREPSRVEKNILRAGNRVHSSADREHLVVEPELLLARGDELLLVVRVVNREILRHADILAETSQDAHAGRVEGSRPDLLRHRLVAKDLSETLLHLLRRFVREGDREHRPRRGRLVRAGLEEIAYLLLRDVRVGGGFLERRDKFPGHSLLDSLVVIHISPADYMRDAVHENGSLSASGAGYDKQRSLYREDGVELPFVHSFVQPREQSALCILISFKHDPSMPEKRKILRRPPFRKISRSDGIGLRILILHTSIIPFFFRIFKSKSDNFIFFQKPLEMSANM